MADVVKDKRHLGSRAKDEKTRERETPENCVICGQKMECDPESGEYYCPVCDEPDQ